MKPNKGTEGVGGSWRGLLNIWPGRRTPNLRPPGSSNLPPWKQVVMCLGCDTQYVVNAVVSVEPVGMCPDCKKVIATFKAILVEEKKMA